MNKILKLSLTSLLLAFVILFCNHDVVPAETIYQTAEDINVIPDEYNTKPVYPQDGYITYDANSTIYITNTEGVSYDVFLCDTDGYTRINLEHRECDLEGTFVFENVDFSKNSDRFAVLGAASRIENQKAVHFVFKNCIFNSFETEREGNEFVDYSFYRCQFQKFGGSNATFNRCYFGGGVADRMVVFCRVHATDCYIANPTSYVTTDGETHVDGVQIYAWDTTEAYDIHFDRCRFEMPLLSYPNSPGVKINACIMLQLEYNNGHDISFTNCHVNGGGMSVYSWVKKGGFSLTDTTFENITLGCSYRYRWLYPKTVDTVAYNIDTWKTADSIYVGSVYRDEDKTYLLVSNDSNKERTFVVYTSSGARYKYNILPCPMWNQMEAMKFEDLPFDQKYTIPEKCDWLVCYETTDGIFKQVRFENWTKKNVTLVKAKSGPKKVVEQTTSTDIDNPRVENEKLVIQWKLKKDVNGYQIKISSNKKFTKKTTTTITVKNKKQNRIELAKLKKGKKFKKGKKYFIKIRTYKYVKIGKLKKKIYSDWGKTKTIKYK